MAQTLLTYSLLATGAWAQTSAIKDYWISPGAPGTAGDYSRNAVYELGSFMTVAWNTDYDSVDIALWQDNNNNLEQIYHALAGNGPGSQQWQVATNKNLSNGHAFFFTVFDANNEPSHYNSHYFNITTAAATSSSTSTSASSLPAATSTPASSSPAATFTSPKPTPSSSSATTSVASTSSMTVASTASAVTSPATFTPSSGPVNNSGLTQQAGIGLGVGVGVGGSLLIGCLVFFLWRHFAKKRARRLQGLHISPPFPPGYFGAEKYGFAPAYELHGTHNIWEAQDSRADAVHELPDRRSRRNP